MSDIHHKHAETAMEFGVHGIVDEEYVLRCAAAEFVGTCILVTFGFGGIAQLALTPNSSWGTMSAIWGLGLTIAIYASALNPAVTLAMTVFRGFSWVDVPIYWAAQSAGAFVGALIVYFLNVPAIRAMTPEQTIGIFVTGLQTKDTSTVVAFFAEFLGTTLLVFAILATSEGRGITSTDSRFQPVVIGATLTAISVALGTHTGFALNPARDIAPRVFTAVAGWGRTLLPGRGISFGYLSYLPLPALLSVLSPMTLLHSQASKAYQVSKPSLVEATYLPL
ncbi:hypothetical protein BGX33_000947 [Mortierella sp. NVP41]|nr:hypothetical protein BGX33_000947 [Mortierella sp. NVP41]